jgi:hypothetical protein
MYTPNPSTAVRDGLPFDAYTTMLLSTEQERDWLLSQAKAKFPEISWSVKEADGWSGYAIQWNGDPRRFYQITGSQSGPLYIGQIMYNYYGANRNGSFVMDPDFRFLATPQAPQPFQPPQPAVSTPHDPNTTVFGAPISSIPTGSKDDYIQQAIDALQKAKSAK